LLPRSVLLCGKAFFGGLNRRRLPLLIRHVLGFFLCCSRFRILNLLRLLLFFLLLIRKTLLFINFSRTLLRLLRSLLLFLGCLLLLNAHFSHQTLELFLFKLLLFLFAKDFHRFFNRFGGWFFLGRLLFRFFLTRVALLFVLSQDLLLTLGLFLFFDVDFGYHEVAVSVALANLLRTICKLLLLCSRLLCRLFLFLVFLSSGTLFFNSFLLLAISSFFGGILSGSSKLDIILSIVVLIIVGPTALALKLLFVLSV